jgi:hypothetical protein
MVEAVDSGAGSGIEGAKKTGLVGGIVYYTERVSK